MKKRERKNYAKTTMGCFSPTNEQMYFQYKISEFQKAGQSDRLTVKDKDKERGTEEKNKKEPCLISKSTISD